MCYKTWLVRLESGKVVGCKGGPQVSRLGVKTSRQTGRAGLRRKMTPRRCSELGLLYVAGSSGGCVAYSCDRAVCLWLLL